MKHTNSTSTKRSGKLHWTQTPAGRRRMRQIQRDRWTRRKSNTLAHTSSELATPDFAPDKEIAEYTFKLLEQLSSKHGLGNNVTANVVAHVPFEYFAERLESLARELGYIALESGVRQILYAGTMTQQPQAESAKG